ncbi:KAP family P-loop NTPase fold protein [Fodinibius sp. Rm-B-1B1-1]|uniref:KAP family P-loop NTPase fold protein n=1 Tax=Fodinibius alkaliphilus TaxID=3140241 RepID=UPI00315A04F3
MKHRIKPRYEREGGNYDYFNRNDFAQNLTRLLSNTEDSLVLTINGDWGEGKTTFIKEWEAQLRINDDFIPIYYDAFQNDFTSDTFISIAVTIQKVLEKHFDEEKKKETSDYKEAAVNLGTELAKMSASTAIRVSTGGVLAADSLMEWITGKYKENKEQKEKAIERSSKELVDSKFDAYFEKADLIQEFHNKLKALLENRDNNKKIVFFVDELDRCRPSFAIEVLEKIKHLFDIDHVNFVLAINREQLVEIITNAYGVNAEDAYVYLQKFVHIETNLPKFKELRGSDDEGNIQLFIADLLDLFVIPEHVRHEKLLSEMIKALLPKTNLTPRSLERILTLYTISLSSNPDKGKKLSKEILFLSILKIEMPKLYRRVKKNGRFRKNPSSLDINLGTGFIKIFTNENYFDQNRLKNSANNMIDIPTLVEAAKIVDIYDLPKEKEGKSKDTNESQGYF